MNYAGDVASPGRPNTRSFGLTITKAPVGPLESLPAGMAAKVRT